MSQMFLLFKDVHIPSQVFKQMECSILTKLDFEVRIVSPIFFLERFILILELDQEFADKVQSQATSFCIKMLQDGISRQYRSSQVAAACFILSLMQGCDSTRRSNSYDWMARAEAVWSNQMEEQTDILYKRDIQEVLRNLI